ncbi:flagellin [Pelosinus fermentans]|uniref:flagellin N-terminal helical domain-containing protein n=1 Tax=Pelosinus fermentans TaxID=365349 RepID=UPI0002685EA2|nr:flagellin [Pelosinus fermentans]OAM92845.1 flagellin domain protein [Pelosinus fermentans DSM 17108]SDQ58707.1 flagellin [Pelosinus fermentans]
MSVVNTNIASLNSWRNLQASQASMNSSLEKLSSGKKINRAADDASGLAISEKMTGQINGLDQATQNAQNGISLIQTAEGALNETTAIIQRLRTLAVQSRNDTNTDDDRTQTNKEVKQLIAEISRIASTTQFNTKNLLNGDATTAVTGTDKGALTFQIGANMGQTITVSIANMSAAAGGLNISTTVIDLSTTKGASSAIAALDTALATVSSTRAELGAVQNRLTHTINNLEVASENLSSARSNLQDTDMAKEMANYSKQQVLIQSGTAMLAQANQSSQSVLKLLQ